MFEFLDLTSRKACRISHNRAYEFWVEAHRCDSDGRLLCANSAVEWYGIPVSTSVDIDHELALSKQKVGDIPHIAM
jgi:hypothetical protein